MTKSKVYTRTGDAGTTSLVGGTRVSKNSPRLEAYGTIDELNSWIGLLSASPEMPIDARPTLHKAQNLLFDIGAILATEPESTWQPAPFNPQNTARLEADIDTLDSQLPRHNQFILPGGHPLAAQANIARTVARRAERRIIDLQQTANVDPEALRYINRLSDYLFILARYINLRTATDEKFWEKQ